ncbi:TSUP family transporter [Streptomyces sp. BRA346]|uniref:TSUP family transporter n=1 Tax=Streptomyces sp. BRA346 TaxID=2878199 RepID=UPI004064127D
MVWADAALGPDAMRVATATSAAVMVVNAGCATAVTPRPVLGALRGSTALLLLLAVAASAGALATRLAPPALILWLYVAYVAITIDDLLLRPGILRPRAHIDHPAEHPAAGPRPLSAVLGAVAAFLGVGGSVMAVPAMRRAGHAMHVASPLANPLTLATAAPATAVSLGGSCRAAHGDRGDVCLAGAAVCSLRTSEWGVSRHRHDLGGRVWRCRRGVW